MCSKIKPSRNILLKLHRRLRQQPPSPVFRNYRLLFKMTVRISAVAVCLATVLLMAMSAPRASAYRYLMQSKLDQCKAAYGGISDAKSVLPRVPSCTAEQIDIQKCCDEVKGVIGAGPADCLCDQDTWNYVQGQVLGAGIPNLNSADTLKAFTQACNIPNKGAGTC